MKKVSIKEGILVSLDRDSYSNTRSNRDSEFHQTLVFTNIKTINCVVDEARGNAIDLETGCVYHVIQRDEWGIVSQEEAQFIKKSAENTLFIYRFHEKNMEGISMLYQIFLNYRAQNKYQEYLQNIENQEAAKVKKIGKKESK